MSLFPAYAENINDVEVESKSVSPRREALLLASDNDEEAVESKLAPASASGDTDSLHSDFYVDRKFDCGNLRVSTLYYPGRPQYKAQKRAEAEAGAGPRCVRRYFEARDEGAREGGAREQQAREGGAELTERTRAYRHMLADRPDDEALWLKFIDFQERHRDDTAALAAATEAAARCPRSLSLRAQLHRLRARALQPQRQLELLRGDLVAAHEPALCAELWLRLLSAVAERGGAELDACVRAALSATRAHPPAYPHILYVYGGYLRAAGLWERLVLLLELVTSMNFGPGAFPPVPDAVALERIELQLQDTEDKVVSSGLPLSTVWARVERARAAAHWRPAPPGGADPQRAPLPADVAELLLPAHAPAAHLALLVNALRLAKVPLLPCAQHVARAGDPGGDAAGDARWAASGEAFLALLRAARRLPAAHGARAAGPAASRRLVMQFVDPPHYLSDDGGYLSWVSALWEASCGWATGAARTALLCWWLRWLHALALLLEEGAEEARRMRSVARVALKRWAGASALPYVQFARLELALSGRAPARRAALRALRAALGAAPGEAGSVAPGEAGGAAPGEVGGAATERLYAARVVGEVAPGRAADWATACAVLGVPLPLDEELERAPPEGLLKEALLRCEEECAAIEAQLEVVHTEDTLLAALLPGVGEWAAARARLAPAPRRRQLLRQVRPGARYWEHAACALALAAAPEHAAGRVARALAPLFPHNALLALACGAALDWGATPAPTTHVGALARALPPLLRAVAADWEAASAGRAARALARLARAGAGGALLATARLEAAARAARADLQGALLGALDAWATHKWLYVRGAAWCPAEAAALADVLLERELRAHALRDELAPPPPPPPRATPEL